MTKTVYTLFTALLISFSLAHADDKMKFNFVNEELTKIIEQYSKASGQKFIIDPVVRGKITFLNPTDVTLEEAYNQLSTGLALNGYAIVKQGDNFIIRNARSAQRDNLEVVSTLPSIKPERMATYVIAIKNVSASEVISQIRMLSSSYGEISALENTNQIIITDWTPNLNRVNEIIKKIDVPMDKSILKIVTEAKKERKERMALRAKESKDPKDVPHFKPGPPDELNPIKQ